MFKYIYLEHRFHYFTIFPLLTDIRTEGLFRKTGNVTRQRLLKEWIKQGAELKLDDGTFSPHDIATVLKQFLAELPEPLLAQKHYDAYSQIVG